MKSFDIPVIYRSPLISAIKKKRKEADKMKKDFTPTLLDFGPVRIYLARHFGFCYGVENAIEIAFRTVEENPGKRIFLLSEMIHNPQVNAGLQAHGIQFLMDTYGKPLIPLSEVTGEDIVLIPAFGTTLDIEAQLRAKGIAIEKYNTTCPFVEKVWNRAEAIAQKGFTVVVHGKPKHEETRATFSHSAAHTPTVVVNDMKEAEQLAQFITGALPAADFFNVFKNQHSAGFNPEQHLQKIGVVNQTTMLAEDTQAIADYLKQVMLRQYGEPETAARFAETRDTLCYATNDNQTAVKGLLETSAQLAVVVGGYNSSNTSHLVELCEEKLPTYFINSEANISTGGSVTHYHFRTKEESVTAGFLPLAGNAPVTILITSGASCPDAVVEAVIEKIISFYEGVADITTLAQQFEQ
jgi:4-hydroxy-3-methylbut-2-en-1-yl diphosphate reductase